MLHLVPGVVAVILAAGAGSRFAGATHKLDARLPDGRTVSAAAIDAALASGIGPVIVVTGAAALDLPAGAEAVPNPDWARGQATSLQAAVAAARARGAEAIVVGLADQPLVTAEAWRLVAASPAPIAVATYDGQRGNPVKLHRHVWPELPTAGDQGARDLVRRMADVVDRVPCPGSSFDVDTVEDLSQLRPNDPVADSLVDPLEGPTEDG